MEKKTEMIGIKTTPEIKRKLIEIAEKEDRSLSWLINKILRNYLEEIAHEDA